MQCEILKVKYSELIVNQGGGLHKTNMKWLAQRDLWESPLFHDSCSHIQMRKVRVTAPCHLSVPSNISYLLLETFKNLQTLSNKMRSCTREMTFSRGLSQACCSRPFPDSLAQGCRPWPVWLLAEKAWPRAASHRVCELPDSPAALQERRSTGYLQFTDRKTVQLH